MSRILFAWEIGAGYGHVGAFLPLALNLRKRGHEVVFALRDLARVETFLGRHEFASLQAPVWLPEALALPPAVSYAEILFRFGFLDLQGLTGMVKGWRELFALVRPDLTIVDHGPTALLAARSLGLKRALFGNGFASPPRVQPLPNFRSWADVPEQRLVDSERRVVEVINQVLARVGGSPLGALAELFDADADFLCTFPELDPYPQRGGAHYSGAVFSREEGVRPEWPSGRGDRIFAYLAPGYPELDKVLRHLAELPHRSFVLAPRLVGEVPKPYASANIAFSDGPVRMRLALAECDLVLCHGGHGTVAQALLMGRPLVLMPLYVEQLLTARRVVSYGAGKMVNPDSKAPSYKQIIRDALGDRVYRDKANAFASRYGDLDPDQQTEALAARCEECLELERV